MKVQYHKANFWLLGLKSPDGRYDLDRRRKAGQLSVCVQTCTHSHRLDAGETATKGLGTQLTGCLLLLNQDVLRAEATGLEWTVTPRRQPTTGQGPLGSALPCQAELTVADNRHAPVLSSALHTRPLALVLLSGLPACFFCHQLYMFKVLSVRG